MPRILAVDIGTSSIRATLYGRGLQPLRQGSHVTYKWRVGADGRIEAAPTALERAVGTAIDSALHGTHAPVDAVAIAAFWHSLVGVDAQGRAATAVLPWTDTRSAAEVERLREELDEHAAHARTGCRFHASYWPSRLRWYAERDAKTFRRVRRWMSFPAYLERRWLGRDAESRSQASGTGLFAHEIGGWDAELCAACRVDPAALGGIVDLDDQGATPSAAIAKRWPALKHARWIPAAGDGAANTVGAGCVSAGRTALMIGTSGALRQMWTTSAAPAVPFSLWRYWLDRRRVVVGGALSNGGNLVAWMLRTFSIRDLAHAERAIARMPPDAHHLTILPFLAGERSPGYLPDATAAINGVRLATTPEEMLRAGLESIAFRFAALLHELTPVTHVTRLVAAGTALSASRVWPQILADVLGRPIALPREPELTSRGAAIIGLEQLGIKPSSIEPAIARVFHPDVHAHDLYKKAIDRQQKLLTALYS